MKLRTVMDTNVLVSGILWRGIPFQLLIWAEEGRLHCPLGPNGGCAFEAEFAEKVGIGHALALSSGTALVKVLGEPLFSCL